MSMTAIPLVKASAVIAAAEPGDVRVAARHQLAGIVLSAMDPPSPGDGRPRADS